MTQPQSGVNSDANTDAVFLTLLINNDEGSLATIRQVLATIDQETCELSARYPDAQLSSVAAIGSHAWDLLYPGQRPAELSAFRSFKQGDRLAPSTPGDLLIHIRSNRKDVNFILSRQLMAAFADSVYLEEEVHGFRYLDSRDMTGFVDGTENPEGEHRAAVTLTQDADFAGGSYIHMQRYVHEMEAWEKLAVNAQEQIIGRSKEDNIEFSSEQKAPTAHIKRVNIKDQQGKGLEIMRHSMPYGDTFECGLNFIAYAKTPTIFEAMLEQMVQADKSGHYDHLLNYTTAVTGCAFFAPSVSFLKKTQIKY